MEDRPNYYSILPANVRYDKRLKPNEKLLYSEITALANATGECWANNNYFAELYDVSTETISRWISHLKECNYLTIEIIKNDKKEIIKRVIRIAEGIDKKINTLLTEKSIPSPQKNQYPIDEKVKENNTSINNTRLIKRNSNSINTITIKKSRFSPPTLEEINEYIKEKNLVVDGKQFFEYFDVGNWIDSKGNKVKNWKQKLLTWNKFKQPVREKPKTIKEMTEEEWKVHEEEERRKFLEMTGGVPDD